MNLWQCDVPGCKITASGTGGAIGLRAIGWYFLPGPVIRCPAHRPDSIPCIGDPRTTDDSVRGQPCSQCQADIEAVIIQHAIKDHWEDLLAFSAARRLVPKGDSHG
jgi:hypothetical protein